MKRILRKAHTYLYLGSVLLYFIIFFPALFIFARNPTRYYKQIAVCRKWICVLSCYTVGIRFNVSFEEEIDWSKNYIICPNHTSILDITAIIYLCPPNFSFMGKIELLDNPVTRIFFKTIDIAVDRKSKIASFRAYKKAEELVKNNKTVVIFPEGKIDDEYPPRLHEFKAGSFKLAIDNQVDIIPVIIQDAWKTLWDDGKKLGSKPGIIHIKVLKPINQNLLSEYEQQHLQEFVFERMNSYWLEYNSHNSVIYN